MKLKSKILIYLFIPIGVLIKVALFVLLLNLPEGCNKGDDLRLKDIESNITVKNLPISKI